MEMAVLGVYPDFSCLAGECPSTCCAGWKISIAFKDYERFSKIEPLWLREDILSNIQKKEGEYTFRNRKNGSCSMLDEDGLCRIQRNTQESALCNTCRKYPRVVNQIDDTLYLSMAASCPVISHYLVCDTVVWLDTSRQRLDVKRLFLIQAEWKQHLENQSYAEAMWKQRKNTEALYGCFEKLASGVLDIILQFQEGLELLSVFQVLEKDCSAQTEEFCQDSSELWKHFRKNYLEYRILSRKIEFPKEEERSCIRQVYGELVLFRTLCFCEYAQGNLAAEGQWEALLQKMYRFCVHGKKVSQAFQTLVSSFFSENYFWNYLLL